MSPQDRPPLEPRGPWSSPWLWVAVALGFILVAALVLIPR